MDAFTAIADPVRRDLLRTLAVGAGRVVDLAADQAISRPAVSKHLKVLADTGLVEAEDVGRERHYRLRAQGLAVVADLLAELAPGALRPPVPTQLLDALDLEVRRAGRDHRDRAHQDPSEPAGHRRAEETA